MKKTEKVIKLVDLTRQWFLDRHIEEGNSDKQTIKLFEEAGELSGAFLRENAKEIKDGIGDVAVVVVGLSMLLNLDTYEVFFGDESTPHEISVEEVISAMLLNGAETFFNKRLQNKFSVSFNLSRILNHLVAICEILEYEFEDCFQVAYDEIKDRKGRWMNGVWIKEQDLKNEKQS